MPIKLYPLQKQKQKINTEEDFVNTSISYVEGTVKIIFQEFYAIDETGISLGIHEE